MASPFPTSLDDDSTLYVAHDNIQTTLSVVQNPTDTVAIVASTSGWAVNMIASIDNEQELVTGVTGSNTLQVTRNFNGTGAVSHPAGRKVSNFVDAAYHAAVSSAIQAIEKSLSGQSSWPGTVAYRSTDGIYYWSFNNVAEQTGIFSLFGQSGGPYVTALPPAAPGPGTAEYHVYYHNAASSAVASSGSSCSFQSYLAAGSGATLSAVWADCTANGAWTPQPASSGITNGPIGGAFTATLAHSTGYGGYACALNIYAVCNGPSAGAQISGMEIDVVNHVAGTGGHAGVMVVDQSTQPTTLSGGDFAFGVTASVGAPGFQQGMKIFSGAIASGGTAILASGSMRKGLDFSGATFPVDGLLFDLPGFVLAPGGVISSPLTVSPSAAGADPLLVQSSVKTSGTMIPIVHGTSTWNGTGISMNFGLGGGAFSGAFITCFVNSVLKASIDANGALISGPSNYIAAETGANNAIVAAVPVALAAGLRVSIKLAHTLQVGANTLNGIAIKSSRNPANNITTAYAVGAIFTAIYDGTVYQDVSQ